MRITKKLICDTIKKELGYDVSLFKVKDDYFYFYSEDDETDLYLQRASSTSVYTNRLGVHSLESWVNCFKRILEEIERNK